MSASASRRALGAIMLAAATIISTSGAARAACDVNNSSTRRTTQRLETIAQALSDYHDAFGALPPAYSVDGLGAPLLSWRVLILPYSGAAALYAQFDLSKPWDDPVNLPLLAQMPDVLRGRLDPAGSVFARFVGVFGPAAAFSGSSGVPFSAMTDGTASTAMIGETRRDIP